MEENEPRGVVVKGGGRGEGCTCCDSLLGDALIEGVADGRLLSWP